MEVKFFLGDWADIELFLQQVPQMSCRLLTDTFRSKCAALCCATHVHQFEWLYHLKEVAKPPLVRSSAVVVPIADMPHACNVTDNHEQSLA